MLKLEKLGDVHKDLCDKLQGIHGDWRRFLICGFRGCFKTSCTKAFDIWYLLTHPNTSVLLVEQRYENAEAHSEEMQWMMQTNGLFLEMYADRIPQDFGGWSKSQFIFNRSHPLAQVSFRIAGLTSRLESKHNDIVHCNDLEGADADTSDVPNMLSQAFLFNRATPLLKSPTVSKILVEGTPHGPDPLVWKVRDIEAEGSTDWESRKNWKIWWLPVHDEEKRPTLPIQAPEIFIDELYAAAKVSDDAQRMLDQQYLLRRRTSAGGTFDMERIRANMFTLHGGRLLRYPVYDYVPGEPVPDPKMRTIDLGSCRFYMHADPSHRRMAEMSKQSRSQPSVGAIVVLAVSPDYHVFVVDTWIKDSGLDEILDAYIHRYRRWAPHTPTFEAIGAQAWFKDAIKREERGRYHEYLAYPRPWDPSRRRLPKLSTRLVEFGRGGKQSIEKEAFIIEQLQVWHNMGWLHLHESQTELLHQHEVFPTTEEAIDGLDALAQGPSVWHPPLSDQARAVIERRANLMKFLRSPSVGEIPADGYYRQPWSDAEKGLTDEWTLPRIPVN